MLQRKRRGQNNKNGVTLDFSSGFPFSPSRPRALPRRDTRFGQCVCLELRAARALPPVQGRLPVCTPFLIFNHPAGKVLICLYALFLKIYLTSVCLSFARPTCIVKCRWSNETCNEKTLCKPLIKKKNVGVVTWQQCDGNNRVTRVKHEYTPLKPRYDGIMLCQACSLLSLLPLLCSVCPKRVPPRLGLGCYNEPSRRPRLCVHTGR